MSEHSRDDEKSAGVQALEILQVIGELLLVMVKMIYFSLLAVYRTVIPAEEVSVNGEIVLVSF